MDKDKVLEALKQIRAQEKRKFTQTIDVAFNLKELDLNKEEGKLEEFIQLPHGRAKPAKICAIVGAELIEQARKFCDLAIISDDFPKWEDKRKIKKLAREYDYFLGQANMMPLIAKTFGRYFGPVGKMPNPKAGQIVPPKGNIEPVVKNLRNTIKVAIKKAPVIHCAIGSEKFTDEQLAENLLAVFERLKSKLPRQQHNISNTFIKTTMGASVKVENA
ncbi:MAG: 50S ribosomal protein L1 [DPANN group archaeon]|nr:50S ribosomal protein L1 [DPANN group archaeon]